MNTKQWIAKEFANPAEATARKLSNMQREINEDSLSAYRPFHSPIDPHGNKGYNFRPSDLSRDVDASLFFFVRGHH